MGKSADTYYCVDPWKIIENGFSPEHAMVSESIFSLGNEYTGVRGYFDEGYSGDRLLGSYINGVFEEKKLETSSYKGIVNTMTYMVNAVDWLYTRLQIDGEELDLNIADYRSFVRILDLKTGVLIRSFVWRTKTGKEVELTFERFLSMEEPHMGGQRIRARALNFNGNLQVLAGLDFSQPHKSVGENRWDCISNKAEGNCCEIAAQTKQSKHKVICQCRFLGDMEQMAPVQAGEKISLLSFTLPLNQGSQTQFSRIMQILSCTEKAVAPEKFERLSAAKKDTFLAAEYDALKAGSCKWWEQMWRRSDIQIEGDAVNQQGIRYCIFQMHQTYHGENSKSVIGAKGLTGEAYSGNTFWDTETYCLPFYLFNNPQAAKKLLMFRYHSLPQARERAKALDCEGAFYPIATIDGRECCNLWQHSSLQLQASTGVAYGIWHYVNVTKDEDFIDTYGVEMLVEICRMLATRGDWSQKTGKYGFYGVMGPDEFQMMVNHNCYTNFMAKKTFEYTILVINNMKATQKFADRLKILSVDSQELLKWADMARNMEIPYDEDTRIFEQCEGFFTLPHIDVDKIPVTEFPLYSHWSYDHIYRNDMIKQPDVLMMMFLYNACFTTEQKLKNYDYYEPRCIHESSLSPSVHSILASELKRHEDAYRFFEFATRLDLDNYNRNTSEGLHTTSIAAAWMNIIYGFGGMRSDGDILSFHPTIPKQWRSYSFQILLGDDTLFIKVEQEKLRIHTKNGSKQTISLYDRNTVIGQEEVVVKIPEQWRTAIDE
ncbi:glycoside hydrolase family 65 protein [Caproiciproducens galactitolivorans]|uniref:Family 65 glycosyl hydrolase n=1 Tax=Caproiciproducens galactitolivorans TaxID=642589 RepID=A0ABT4BP78_9FIRM|nr:glycosyl hydrolase family 65 protein [Caproiciproducens galactitolivorans]MCY1712689.1 family 65 glycosyl hydrolase [Caproiciproducens galactitolivorans]